MPLEGVVHALRNIHSALVPDAILVDTQPVSAHPPVAAGGVELGALDMREWIETIDAVDDLLAETIDAGLYELQREEHITVTDEFDDGPECVETVSGWRGTNLSSALAVRLATAHRPIAVRQQVRLRLMRRAG